MRKWFLLFVIVGIVSNGWSQFNKLKVAYIWSKNLGDVLRTQMDPTAIGTFLMAEQEGQFNQALFNSHIPNLEMEIVYAQELDFKDELNQDCFRDILDDMKAPGSIFQNIRINQGVDVVFFGRLHRYSQSDDEGVAGCAELACKGEEGICDPSIAFATGQYRGGVDFVFTHEVGHVLGLHHTGLSSSGLFDFAYGYQYEVNGQQWGTMMDFEIEYPNRVHGFSNPNVDHGSFVGRGGHVGIPIGNATNANASLALELIAPLAAEMKLTKPDLHENMIHENLARGTGGVAWFKFEIPGFHQNLRIILEGGTGDADLYIGKEQLPVIGDGSTIACQGTGGTNNEVCPLYPNWSEPTTYYIMVKAYNSFQGVTLRAEVDPPKKIGKYYPATNLSGYSDYFIAEIDHYTSNVEFRLTGQNGNYGNADLNIWYFDDNGNRHDCVSQTSGNNEICSFYDGRIYYINVIGASNYGGVTLSVDYDAGPPVGNLTRDVWNGISGSSVSDLEISPDWEEEYSSTNLVSQFEAPTNIQGESGDNYGTQIHGYYYPPMSGYYRFYVAGDDNVQLWLSSDDNPDNSKLVADHLGWTNTRQWNKYASQVSDWVYLRANKKYYIRGLHKEGTGGDNFAAAIESEYFPLEIIQGHSTEAYIDTKGPNIPSVMVLDNLTFNPGIQIASQGGGIGTFLIEDKFGTVTRNYTTTSSTFRVETFVGEHRLKIWEIDRVGNVSEPMETGVNVLGTIQKDIPIQNIVSNDFSKTTYLLEVPSNYTPGSLVVNVIFQNSGGSMFWVNYNVKDRDGPAASCWSNSPPYVCDINTPEINIGDWQQSGNWYLTVYSYDNPATLTATYQTGGGTPGISGTPGLHYGTVAGNINTTAANPKTSITTSLSETENSIAGNTTEIYTGMIYDADGNISFTEDIDDKVRLYIDDVLRLSSDNWNDRTSTGNLNLTPGYHKFELRISNGSGGSGPRTFPGFGYDPNGGTNWVHPSDPGDGSLFHIPDGPQPGVPYQVQYVHSGKCLGVVNGSTANAANVEQQTCNDSYNHQKLTLNPEPDGFYSLKFEHSGQVVDINNGSSANGASVIQWPLKPLQDRNNQMFELVDHNNGTYSFKFKHSQRCVDIYNVQTNDGANVIQWDCHYRENQRFRFVESNNQN